MVSEILSTTARTITYSGCEMGQIEFGLEGIRTVDLLARRLNHCIYLQFYNRLCSGRKPTIRLRIRSAPSQSNASMRERLCSSATARPFSSLSRSTAAGRSSTAWAISLPRQIREISMEGAGGVGKRGRAMLIQRGRHACRYRLPPAHDRRQRSIDERCPGTTPRPELVHGGDAERILHRFRNLSANIGTEIDISDGVGFLGV